MSFTCRTCSRMNPPEALYCYYDGVALDGAHSRGPVAAGAQKFPTPFVMPSGQSAGSFDELVLACEADWDAARSVLQHGFLEGFLGGLGRVDLAMLARKSAQSPDLDHGLDELIAKFPSTVREPAKLQVGQREIDLGELLSGTDRRLTLNLKNAGMGLLQGTVSCADTPWLAVGDAPAGPQKMFHCRQDMALPVQVVGRSLRANAKPLTGKLIIETNGGALEVLVSVRVPIKPFPEGVLAGARSPRQVAEKAKAAAKDAAVLFASGAVAAWYESNGWTYPVQGPSATGLGAVQQFFEALGLVAAPKVTISTERVQFRGAQGAHLEQVIQVQTIEKRPVFANAVSKSAWLQIGKVQLKGQIAYIPLQIPSVPSMPGEELQTRVEVAANGNQHFTVNVALAITEGSFRGVRPAATLPLSGAMGGPTLALLSSAGPPPLPMSGGPPLLPMEIPPVPSSPGSQSRLPPPPIPVTPSLPSAASPFDFQRAVDVEPVHVPAFAVVGQRSPGDGGARRGWKHLLPLLLLVLGLGGMLLHDYWLPASDDTTVGAGPPEIPIDPEPYLSLQFHNREQPKLPEIVRQPTMTFGLVMDREEKKKRLTFSPIGLSNNTCVRVDGKDFLFGRTGNGEGQWVEQEVPRGKDLKGRSIDGTKSVWAVALDGEKIVVNQVAEIVPSELLPGETRRRLDTCLIHYEIKNEGTKDHLVGIRFLLDTFIGARDGVPFTIPGRSGLCDTSDDFPTPDKVPDYIQVLENEDLSKPGTVARVQFKIGEQFEAPGRVQLGGWPERVWKLRGYRDAEGEMTRWNVPRVSMRGGEFKVNKETTKLEPDSAVVLYWNPKSLKPGEVRKVGFSYGIGKVASEESGGKLLLTVGGSMAVDREFTLTALVQDPAKDETLTLELPTGIEFVEGKEKETVPPVDVKATRKVGTLTWKIKATKAGEYPLVVKSSKGVKQTVTIRIKPRGVFD